uniref:DDE-1 domain-containing protein n=1 Tax=Heterorhabditis bacteriophora TaxID=37862 RepID=A0A1I7WHE5_HETBA
MECSSRNPDLNPIVHLWNDVEKEVQRQKPSNIKALEAVMKKAWTETPFERCANLVDSMPRRYLCTNLLLLLLLITFCLHQVLFFFSLFYVLHPHSSLDLTSLVFSFLLYGNSFLTYSMRTSLQTNQQTNVICEAILHLVFVHFS